MTKLRKIFFIIVLSLCALLASGGTTYIILSSDYHVDDLEYADVDFEWIDDFGNYEVSFSHHNRAHYLRVPDKKVKLIYTTEDFLNFLVIDYSKRIRDGEDHYTVKVFYININYKENKDDNF